MFIYLGVSLFGALFGYIYELNGHGIYSFDMLFGFIYPLIGGFLFYFLLFIFKCKSLPSFFSSCFYNAGVATLTVASYFKGVLDIYGTTNEVLYNIYLIVGIPLFAIGIVSYIATLVVTSVKNK